MPKMIVKYPAGLLKSCVIEIVSFSKEAGIPYQCVYFAEWPCMEMWCRHIGGNCFEK
jgi:hypothetical protein